MRFHRHFGSDNEHGHRPHFARWREAIHTARGRDPGGMFDEESGHRGHRRRMFDGGELRLLVLKLIGEQPRYGYDVIRAIEEMTGGAYSPSPGVVYPTVSLLTDMGLIAEQAADGTRKLHAITAEGTAHLAEHAEEVRRIVERLEALAAVRQRPGAMPLRRALHNLRSVLEHRVAAGIDQKLLYEAVALIDEAAAKIERLE